MHNPAHRQPARHAARDGLDQSTPRLDSHPPAFHREAEQSALRLELERNRLVVQLAGAVAHKLKQPLAVAWGYLELLLDDANLQLAPSTLRYLREIQESLHTMDEVINALQRATTAQTRPYAGGTEILDLEPRRSEPHPDGCCSEP